VTSFLGTKFVTLKARLQQRLTVVFAVQIRSNSDGNEPNWST
jgi:hypothetical protein